MKKYTIDRTCSDLARQACETKPVSADKKGVNERSTSIGHISESTVKKYIEDQKNA